MGDTAKGCLLRAVLGHVELAGFLGVLGRLLVVAAGGGRVGGGLLVGGGGFGVGFSGLFAHGIGGLGVWYPSTERRGKAQALGALPVSGDNSHIGTGRNKSWPQRCGRSKNDVTFT